MNLFFIQSSGRLILSFPLVPKYAKNTQPKHTKLINIRTLGWSQFGVIYSTSTIENNVYMETSQSLINVD